MEYTLEDRIEEMLREKNRADVVKWFVVFLTAATVLINLIAYLVTGFEDPVSDGEWRLVCVGLALFMVFAFLGPFLIWLYFRLRKNYALSYKYILVRRAMVGLYENIRYDSDRGNLLCKELQTAELIGTGKRMNGADLVEGSCNGVPFSRSDLNVLYEKKNGEYDSRFWGVVYAFPYPKDFVTDLQILSMSFLGAKFQCTDAYKLQYGKRHTIETENETFNEMFLCRCQADTEAFYLLTPGMMQKLTRLQEAIGYPFMAGFVNRKLYIVVRGGGDRMEPPFFRRFDLNREAERVRDELLVIRRITEIMELGGNA